MLSEGKMEADFYGNQVLSGHGGFTRRLCTFLDMLRKARLYQKPSSCFWGDTDKSVEHWSII